ncbi:hypothetical protein [Leucobacter soli]
MRRSTSAVGTASSTETRAVAIERRIESQIASPHLGVLKSVS